jgi:phosphoribosylanthranilate isomerase
MSVFVKICGLTTAEALDAAVETGADAVGFVFAESPRKISVAEAVALVRDLPDTVVRFAVMFHPTQAEWDEVAAGFAPDWIQTDAQDFSRLDIDADVRRMPVYRDRPNLDTAAVAREAQCLFEASASGAGAKADWNIARLLARKTRLMLAGGLTPENVGAAIRQVRPWGVDVSSGVESNRGVKDPQRIVAFINAVRELECADAS